jgi:hypothetical protein
MIEVLYLSLEIANDLTHSPNFVVIPGNISQQPLHFITMLRFCKMLLSRQVFALLFESLVLILPFKQLLSQRKYLAITLL